MTHRLHRWLCSVAGALGVALLCGCASPAQRFLDDAATRGFGIDTARAGAHTLVTVASEPAAPGAALHVYLDGDGRPWQMRRRAAADPTSRRRLVLDLMARDPVASVLVGRPCYYRPEQQCDPAWWTAGRYGEAVVAAMAAAIDALVAERAPARITLIGYSGGGALAMLIAPRLRRVDRVVTLAANLDVAGWAAHHGHAPLADSLDPARAAPLPAGIVQLHLFGADDTNVPAALMRSVAERQQDAQVRVLPGFDHDCCWAEAWPALMSAGDGAPDSL